MHFHLRQRYLIATNFVLIAALAWFAALSVNDVVAWRLAAHTPQIGPSSAPVPKAAVPRSRADYQAIVRRDIFNRSPLSARAPGIDTSIKVKLIGTSRLTLMRPFVIVQDPQGKQSLYRLGDVIPGAGKLVEVLKSRAIIERRGQRVAITIPVDVPTPTSPSGLASVRSPNHPGSANGDDAEDVQSLGPNHYAISRATIDQNFLNLGELLTSMRAVPHTEHGKTTGFELSEIDEDSLFGEMGLKDGDVVTHINNQALNDPTRAMQMIPTLRNRRSVTVRLTRDGRPVTLRYDIH